MQRFFSFSPNGGGMEFHDTAEAARSAAEDCLDDERDNASDSGWSENAGEICWGEVWQVCVQSSVPAEEGATFDGEPITEYISYDLTNTQPKG